MSIIKTLAITAAVTVGAASFALAQQGNPASNAGMSGGSGTHQSAQKTGSAANDQKVLHNQNGYRGGRIYNYRPRHRHHKRHQHLD
jgi:hypothetical protein